MHTGIQRKLAAGQKMTKKSILERRDYLSLLARSRSKKRRNALIEIAETAEIRALAEILVNTLHGNLPLTEAQYKRIRKYKGVLRKLAGKRHSVRQQKNILKQKGGFLGALIPIAMTAISSLLKG